MTCDSSFNFLLLLLSWLIHSLDTHTIDHWSEAAHSSTIFLSKFRAYFGPGKIGPKSTWLHSPEEETCARNNAWPTSKKLSNDFERYFGSLGSGNRIWVCVLSHTLSSSPRFVGHKFGVFDQLYSPFAGMWWKCVYIGICVNGSVRVRVFGRRKLRDLIECHSQFIISPITQATFTSSQGISYCHASQRLCACVFGYVRRERNGLIP